MPPACHESFEDGETDLQEILQLCNHLSSDHFMSPQFSSPPERQIQPAASEACTPSSEIFQNQLDEMGFGAIQQNSEKELLLGSTGLWDGQIQIHTQRRKEIQELGIYLGISNDLATPMRNHSSYPMLESQLRVELVTLYFDHVHPLYPVIDEQNFWWHFITLSEDEFSETFPAIMFHAMLFAAFGHATEEQVQRAGFNSVYEVQSRYVRILSEMHDYSQLHVSCELDEVVLAKVSLLLSLWCPPKVDIAVISLWIDRAMYHLKRYLRKTLPAKCTPMPKRHDILVWCCVSRNIFISYAMRRPYQLCMEEEPLCAPEDVRAEFDRELHFHQFCSPAAKVGMVEDFVNMCKLSQKLRNILYFQGSMLLSIQDSEQVASSWGENEKQLRNCINQYLRAAEAEANLMDHMESQEDFRFDGADSRDSERALSVSAAAQMRSYILQIITLSSIVSLYKFTISTTSTNWARSCHQTALTKMFDASQKVASVVEHMLSHVPIEAIPGTLLIWITSPAIPLLVEHNCSKFGLPGLSTYSDADSYADSEDFDPSSHLAASELHERQIASLLELTSRMASRFHSARDVLTLLQNADHILCLDAASTDSERVQRASMISLNFPLGHLTAAESSESKDLLVKVMKFVESEMTDGVSASIL